MGTFEKIKAFSKNVIVNIMKWIVIFVVSSILGINSVELIILLSCILFSYYCYHTNPGILHI